MKRQPALLLAMALFLIMTCNADAVPLKWRADLTVDFVEDSVSGISLGDQFSATFEVDASLFDNPEGIWESKFVSFDITIGGVNWNALQQHDPPKFLLGPDGLSAVATILTKTTPAHPDLYFFLPQSPNTWQVLDELDETGLPIFGGDFGGTYTVKPVPEPSTFLMLGAVLVGLAVNRLKTKFRGEFRDNP